MEKIDLKDFGKSVLQTIYDLDELQCNQTYALDGVLAEIRELIDLNDKKILESRHTYFQIPNTSPGDYEEHFFELTQGKFALAGIRHINGEKDRPFVQMLLGFLPSDQDLELIKSLASEHFKKFAPKHVSLWLRPSLELSKNLEGKGYSARRYFVADIKAISQLNNPKGYERINLRKVESDLDMHWYKNTYSEFHHEQPELAPWVPMTDIEDLQQCMNDGLLFEAIVDGFRAGMIAARREKLLGQSGVYMTELLLAAPYKGSGLAAALQRKFLDQLDSDIKLGEI